MGVIDVDNDSELLFGDDIDIEDIVWYGSVDSVSQMAASVGVAQTAPMSALSQFCSQARAAGRTLHFLPPYRHDTMLTITDLLGIHHSRQRDEASLTLIRAVVKMRSSHSAVAGCPGELCHDILAARRDNARQSVDGSARRGQACAV